MCIQSYLLRAFKTWVVLHWELEQRGPLWQWRAMESLSRLFTLVGRGLYKHLSAPNTEHLSLDPG
jgi:hypothetical protein